MTTRYVNLIPCLTENFAFYYILVRYSLFSCLLAISFSFTPHISPLNKTPFIFISHTTYVVALQIVPLSDNVTEVATTMAMTPNGTDAEKEMIRALEYKDGMNVLGKL